MRLKRLEIYGFKSFADRTVVVFDEGITGIVGPNGSGKSNLSDAVRWVLGEQSAKALRGGKMEDVIFNGTQKRKRMGYCEVSLVFENEDHALSVDYTEVMITRRVYRSGEGEYYINKSACRLKDIVELFRDTGVGKEGYSIIGQGRIDEILSQKSEDRRGVFEEAAGIVKYRTRKEESEKRLSNMRDNLSRVEDIIAELESQLEPLEKASETARRYLNLRDELRVLECSAFVLRSDRAKERIAEAEQLLTGLKEAIASEEKRADALSEQREKANEGAQKLENEVTAAHDAVLELTRETEAVLGGALQNVVTTDEYIARDMIAYLRQNKLGRATFLPMTTISGRTLSPQERQVLTMPGCVGVASELIEFDEQYRGIVENLLGRTVIAENLDAGIEIMRRGRHAFRLVTLEGDVMHSGGSMTGGSSASRMTSLLSREREIKEHEKLLAELEEKVADYGRRIERGEAIRQEIKQRRAQAFEAIRQAQIDVSVAQERVRTLTAQREEHRAQQDRCALLRTQIAQNLAQIDSQLAGARDTQAGEQKTNEEMNRQTAALSDALYEKREALDALREEAQNLRVTLAACERDANALNQDGARMRREQSAVGVQIGEAHENREALTLRHQQSMQQLARDAAEQQTCAGRLEAAQQNLAARQSARNEEQETIRQLTQEIDSLRETLAMDMDKCHKAELVLGRTQSELEQMQQRIWDDYELTYAGAKEYLVEPFDMAGSDKRAGDIRREIRAMGPVNVTAMEDYRACRERYDDLAGQRDDLVKAQDDLLGIIESLQRQMEKQFLENFRLLQQYLSETFVKLFGGGKAELRLMDEKDVLGCGIEIVAQPPGKKLQMLSLLSGGERALTAIAILFAMLRLKPTPFCFLDEIEAALDDGNISTFADYLRDFSKDTQFVVVTHRKGTMERCDGLYGVAMEEKGVSKMLSVELKDVSAEAME